MTGLVADRQTVHIDSDLQKLLPPLAPQELAELEASILVDGIREPLIVWRTGRVLVDGHNRLRIAEKHGLPYRVTELDFADHEAARQWVIRNQLSRRNLTPDAASYLRGLLVRAAPRDSGARTDRTSSNSLTRLQAMADEHGVTRQTLHNDAVFADAVDTIAEAAGDDALPVLLSGKVAKKDVLQVAKLPPEQQAEVIKRVQDDGAQVKAAVREVAREETEAKAAQITADPEWATKSFRLILADVADGLPEVADDSVDFIITDPPYPQDYLHTYSDLSKLALRVLKPGGSLLAMAGQSYLPEVMARLSECLDYHWTVAYLTPGGQAVQVWDRKVNTFWKPVLWFTKGEYTGAWIGDVTRSAVNDNDKQHHKWGQSESGMADLIERFTKPGDTILDPFVGGGTTAVVAVALARYVIAADVDQRQLDITAGRLAQMAPNGRPGDGDE